MNTQKRYLIELLLKRIGIEKQIEKNIQFSFKMLSNTYSFISDEELKEIKNIFNAQAYFNLIIPIYEENFSIDEIKELIKFYSSDLGQKLINGSFLKEVEEQGNLLFQKMEREFAKRNYK